MNQPTTQEIIEGAAREIDERFGDDCPACWRYKEVITRHLAPLIADRERLDWLEKHNHWILCAESGDGYSMGRNDNFQNWATNVSSVRTAIDHARTSLHDETDKSN